MAVQGDAGGRSLRMKVAFRADASLEIGTGHVMRCLTLARALRERGHDCLFISREHPGNLLKLVSEEGFAVQALPVGIGLDSELAHSKWLGASQAEDALACKELLAAWRPDWLVVDHYALDYRWEISVRPVGCHLLVIDDLADRQHNCDVLLDQNLGRSQLDYQFLLPRDCTALIGPHYALLRHEFAALRSDSMARRRNSKLENILISLGGVDQSNHAGLVLDALSSLQLPASTRLTLVLGPTAPHLQAVIEAASHTSWQVEVLCGINNMAQRMFDADLAIGAAGGSSWERCCLGLPTLLLILAENQKSGGLALAEKGAALLIDPSVSLKNQLKSALDLIAEPQVLQQYSIAASHIADGLGCSRVIETMEAR